MPEKIDSNRAAFTLFELLLVLVLTALIYGLAINRLQMKAKSESVTLDNLKSHMLPFADHIHTLSLICTDECSKCLLYRGETKIKDMQINPFHSSKPRNVYTIDFENRLQKMEALHIDVADADKPICFRYDIFPNDSSSELAVFMEGEYIYLPAFGSEVKHFVSPETLRECLNDIQKKALP